MYDAVMGRMADFDIIIGAAAVADYRVESPMTAKIKRLEEPLSLRLVPNRDIIASVAAARRPEQKVVGFAAESNDLIKHGEQKLLNKRLDMLVANAIGGDQCAVGADKENAFILVPGKPAEELVRSKNPPLQPLSLTAWPCFETIPSKFLSDTACTELNFAGVVIRRKKEYPSCAPFASSPCALS